MRFLKKLIYIFIFVELAPAVERVLGSWRFVLLYLAAGAAGIAVAEVFDPSIRLVGTIVAAFALMGSPLWRRRSLIWFNLS